MRNPRVALAIVVAIIGVLAVAAGVMYLTVSAHALPSFIPGSVKGIDHHKHTHRGEAGVALGVVLLVVAIVVERSGRRRRRWR
ncbi:MAG: hypothetical protein ABSE47_14245 [Acidimicrobiales bacterium]|jgi:hypothetical protein